MMLFTSPRLPASWVAMLPQKFSAATTLTRPDPDAAVAAYPPPQPVARRGRSSTRAADQRTTTPYQKVRMSLIPVLVFSALPFSAMTGRQWSDHVHATLA